MKKTNLSLIPVTTGLCLFACALANTGNAAPSIYFDINGVTTGSGVASAGSYTWEGNNWDLTSGGTGAATAFVEGDFARFSAGTDAAAKNYTITANANHTIGGMFLQANGGGTVTINGPGVLSIDPTGGPVQGFLVNSASQTLVINAVLGGAGGVENENSGSLDLYGNNTYSGGTILGTVAGLNFNNNNSFGTGSITWGVATQVLADPAAVAPITIANSMFTRTASTLIITGPTAAPVNFSGAWTLDTTGTKTSTVSVGSGAFPNTVTTISGAISGTGANLVKAGTGTLILTGANTYSGTTTISAGRLTLGVNNAIASSSGVIMSGNSVLDLGGNFHTMGSTTLTISGGVETIDGEGGNPILSFANSSGTTWTGILNLANWDPSADTLQFGTDATGLTAAQLADIEVNGGGLGTATIDSSGFINIVPEPSTNVLFALGGLGLVVGSVIRRRRTA